MVFWSKHIEKVLKTTVLVFAGKISRQIYSVAESFLIILGVDGKPIRSAQKIGIFFPMKYSKIGTWENGNTANWNWKTTAEELKT